MVSEGMESLTSVEESTNKNKSNFYPRNRLKTQLLGRLLNSSARKRGGGVIGVRQEGAYEIGGALGGGAELGEHGDEEIIRKPVEVVRPRLRRRRSKPPSFPDARFCPLLPLSLIPARSSLDDLSASSPALGSHCRRRVYC